MRIDAHQHFWRYSAAEYPWISDEMAAIRRDFLPVDLGSRLNGLGFDACVAVQALHSTRETEWLLDLADEHDFIAGVVGWVDLCSDTVGDSLTRLTERRKLVGIRHIVQDEPDPEFLLRADFGRGLERLAAAGLPYDILIYPRHVQAAASLVERHPTNRFVLDHLAKPEIRSGRTEPWASDLRRLARAPHICAKISGLVTEADWQGWSDRDLHPYLQIAYDCFGPDRLLIGSDWPVSMLAGGYAKTMAPVVEWASRLPARERDAILGGNAIRAYGLSERR